MPGSSSSRVRPCVRVLDDGQIAEIHGAALRILERTGVLVLEEEARELLSGAGCAVSEGNRVRIPQTVIESALQAAPKGFTLSDRDGSKRLDIQGRRSYWGTGSDVPFILDSFTGERRRTSLRDIEDVSRIVDSLPHLDFLMCMGVAHELPKAVADKHHFLAMADNSSKPIVFTASSLENLRDIREMAGMIRGSEEALRRDPFIVHYTEPVAPLIHPRDSLQKLLFCAEKGIPIIYTSATTAAQNGPATLAGSLAQCTARILSGIAIAQLKRKGAPMAVTFHASAMDPRTAIHPYASPEHLICQAASRDLASHYGLPTWGRAGCTESKVVDQQAGFEAGWEILMQALSGENLIHDVGYIESGLTASWESIVMCDEFIAAATRVVNGFELSPETLALDLIDSVGPSGHYLTEEHTLSHYRRETWIPGLIDRGNHARWVEEGRTTLLDRANRKVREILDTHSPKRLPPSMRVALQELARKDNTMEQRKYYGGTQATNIRTKV